MRRPIEVVSYIGPDDRQQERKLTGEGIDRIVHTLCFVFGTSVQRRVLGETQPTDTRARFYLINAHGCIEGDNHHIETETGLVPTADMLLKDLLARDPHRKTPTIILVDACQSGRLLKEFPSDVAIYTSDATEDICYAHANIFQPLATALETVPLLTRTVTTGLLYRMIGTCRTDGKLLKRLVKEISGAPLSTSYEEHTPKENTTGYNNCHIELVLPKRTLVDVFNGYERNKFDLFFLHASREYMRDVHYVSSDLPDRLKRRYVRLLRSRADHIDFGYTDPVSTSFKLLEEGAHAFGIPFCERILNTLAITPTHQWEEVWHTYWQKYAPEGREDIL